MSKPRVEPAGSMAAGRAEHRLRATRWFVIGVLTIGGFWATGFGRRWPSIYYMTGPSMEPTLAAREHFIVWNPPDRLAHGDLVLFRYVDEDGVFHVLRRLVALAGDTVAMDSGVVLLNGAVRDWPYRIVTPEVERSELAIEGRLFDFGPWIVPPDSAVLLADTRDMVGWPDSRFLGPIPVGEILGRATRTLKGRSLR